MNTHRHYLALIEQLVRAGRSEREIERIVKQLVKKDTSAFEVDPDDLRPAA